MRNVDHLCLGLSVLNNMYEFDRNWFRLAVVAHAKHERDSKD